MAEKRGVRAREIIEAATRLFAGNGYDGVSVRDICSLLSVNSSIISYYFGGKSGLYYEVLKNQFKAYGQALDSVVGQSLSPKEELAALCEAIRALRADNPYFSALMTRESGGASDEYKRAAAEHREQYGDRLADLIRRGQRQGQFRADIKIQSAALILHQLLNGAALAGEDSGVGSELTENGYFEAVKAILLEGLLADEGDSDDGRRIGKQSAKPHHSLRR